MDCLDTLQPVVNADRLLLDIRAFGQLGRDPQGRLTRLAGTEADKQARDALVARARAAGLAVEIDQIGNIFAIWSDADNRALPPVLLGSHIDTVINAGHLDGTYGVLAALEVIRSLKDHGFRPARPIVAAAFTNEEGVRFAPDMMGSAVFTGVLPLKDALQARDAEGATLASALAEIGYAGMKPLSLARPHAYLELHIEQGPILDCEGVAIGVVEGVQGILWRRIAVRGEANHAGTTPMALRRDAGSAAARLICRIEDLARRSANLVATVGTLELKPGAINVVPGEAVLTIDMRSPDEKELEVLDVELATFLAALEQDAFQVSSEVLARSQAVTFAPNLVDTVERCAHGRGLGNMRLSSGAGHDAQLMASMVPTAMIFVPSIEGISHNPREATKDEDLIRGAQVLLDVVATISTTVAI